MSKAIISPSVLAVGCAWWHPAPTICWMQLADVLNGAGSVILIPPTFNPSQSDLSSLSSECKRMLSEGADWLHMGRS
jgi:hypothetical protein